MDTTERLHLHFSLAGVGEGNGNPLRCSCLENPRDGGAWWAAVYGVAQSRTRLKRLSSKCINGDFEPSRIEMRMKEPKVCEIFSRELENREVTVYPLRLH